MNNAGTVLSRVSLFIFVETFVFQVRFPFSSIHKAFDICQKKAQHIDHFKHQTNDVENVLFA